ncbi:MAG: hypothetical protein AABW53_01405 [Nanoarchaeota archaeon]
MFTLDVTAEIVDYEVVTRLNNKNIGKSGQINYSVDIFGSGNCTDAWIQVIPEGKLDFSSSLSVKHTRSLDPTLLIPLEFESLALNGNPNCSPDTIKTIETTTMHLDGVHFGELNYLNFLGKIDTTGKIEGGDYDLNIIFSCKKGEDWHIFSNKSTFHIKYWLEELQYLSQYILMILSFIFGICANFLSNLIFAFWNKPINFIEDEVTERKSSSGIFYRIIVKNKGKSASKNCTSRIILTGKIDEKDLFLETLLPWAPALNSGIVDINVDDARELDLCLYKDGSIVIPNHKGYNNHEKPLLDGIEVDYNLDMSKLKTLRGNLIISSENATILNKKLIINYDNNNLKIKIKMK